MIQDGISLSESKLGGLKEKMNSAIHGVRRIAHEFNTDMLVIGRIINIGKSRVHDILASAKIYKQNNILNNKPKHLKRLLSMFQLFDFPARQFPDITNLWKSAQSVDKISRIIRRFRRFAQID